MNVEATLCLTHPAPRADRMRRAAQRLMAVLEEAVAAGRPPIAELLDGRAFVEWEHYPDDDFWDAGSGVLAFYHAHAQGDRPAAENGHFHCFVDRRFVSPDARPVARPVRHGRRQLCHLVGLSLDARGVPCELFTTNQWVTGEWLYPAAAVGALLPRLAEVPDAAPRPLRWLAALVSLFEPEIEDLLRRRDEALALSGPGARRRAADRDLDVLSSLRIDVDAQLERIEADAAP